jgi:hypothetical protein
LPGVTASAADASVAPGERFASVVAWNTEDVAEPSLTGTCLCGGVHFEVGKRPESAAYCHCTRCQRRSGTAASAQARVDGDAVRMVRGGELVKWWRHPDGGFEKGFCRECGSQLFSRDPDDHRRLNVRMGAFDGDPGVRPGWRSYVAYAAEWEPIPDDGLERFAETRASTA